jgi:RNA polymerase sigma-70 factor (ECF subfamily)
MSLSKPQGESQPGSHAPSSPMTIGSDAEFEVLFRAHYAPLCAFVSRMIGSRAVAEELVQEVFLYLWEHRATWSAHTSVRTYLFTSARNATLNYRRREKLEERATHSDEDTIALFTRTQVAIEREVALAEFERAVKRAIAQLPRRCGEVYALSREQFLSYAEIGDVLGISPKTVEVHMGRAFKLLRKHLAPYLRDM